jgi:hypothetical protein
MTQDLREVLTPLSAVFESHQIRYAVIGGYAVAAWGPIRATQDIDLFCSLPDVSRLVKALGDAGYRPEHRLGDPEHPVASVVRIAATGCDDLFDIEVLSGIRGAPARLLDRVRWIQLRDLRLPVASPEDTIVLKLIGGSAQDLADASGIIRAQGTR